MANTGRTIEERTAVLSCYRDEHEGTYRTGNEGDDSA